MRELSANKCAEFIESSTKIAVLTGAGISTSAGIADFRGPEGIYATGKYNPETVFNINYFLEHPKEFYDFSRDFLDIYTKVKPTFGHIFLAEIEAQGKLAGLITQNIDPLHKNAGSRNLIELHGSYNESFCLSCGRKYSLAEFSHILLECEVPRCECNGLIKPDVVFFGEAVNGMDAAERIVSEADLFLVIGSSLTVFPAAFLPDFAECPVLVINKGNVSISAPENTWLASEDIDYFLRQVAHILNIQVK